MENKNEAAVNTPKKKIGKIVLRVLAIILAVIVAFTCITAIITVITLKANVNKAHKFPAVGSELKFEEKENGNWNIYTDKELKVIQFTDTHFGGGWLSAKKDAMAMNAVAAMISAEKPDFVIFTGDMAYPVPFQAGTANNKSGAKLLAELMETLGVYWTVSYGNHDTESYSLYDRKEITDFYAQYPHCLARKGDIGVDGYCNQVFRIINSDGIITRMLFTVDSHSYVDGDIFGILWKYDNIHENQIVWYRNSINKTNVLNKKAFTALDQSIKDEKYKDGLPDTIPSSVFLHVPLEEYKIAWNEYVENGYKDTENTKYTFGVAGESGKVVYPGIYSDNFFETMLSLGSTDSVFCGHDHLNNFSVNYKGINLTYSYSVDYLAYMGISKLGSQRGCTVITIAPDGTINYTPENYYQDKYISHFEKEEVTMQELGQ